MNPKQAGFLDTGLSFVPGIGGDLSGSVKAVNGESLLSSQEKLHPYSIGGSVAGPLAFLFGKSPLIKRRLTSMVMEGKSPITKEGLKALLIQSVIASGIGSAAGVMAGRGLESRHFSGKYGSEKLADGFLGNLANSAGDAIGNFGHEIATNPWQAAKDTASGVGHAAKWWFVDPFINAKKDFGDSISLAQAGDTRAALGKGLTGVGNAGFGLMNFIPGVGLLGKGVGLGAKALGAGAKLVGATEAARGIEGAGVAAEGLLKAPRDYLSKTPGLSHVFGDSKILQHTPKPAIDPGFAGNVVRGAANLGRSVVNATPNMALLMGPSMAGDALYNSSDSGRMDAIMESPLLQKYVDAGLGDQYKALSQSDKLEAYHRLQSSGQTKALADLEQRQYDAERAQQAKA